MGMQSPYRPVRIDADHLDVTRYLIEIGAASDPAMHHAVKLVGTRSSAWNNMLAYSRGVLLPNQRPKPVSFWQITNESLIFLLKLKFPVKIGPVL